MNVPDFIDSEIFKWVVLPLLIFLARICDQTIGTIRIVFISRGDKWISPILGFIEVFIWVLAIRQILYNLSNVVGYVAYAGGFATGNFIGMLLEEKIALGKRIMQIITQKDASKLIKVLNRKGYGVTNIPAQGARGRVNVIYTIIDRSDLDRVIKLVERINPGAFYSIENVLSVKEGVFPDKRNIIKRMFPKSPRLYRKMNLSRKFRMLRKGK
ncbi:MAG: DUF2179 domain-containing protein [bacterium]